MRCLDLDRGKMLMLKQNQFRLQVLQVELLQNPPIHSLRVDHDQIQPVDRMAVEQGRHRVRANFFPNDFAFALAKLLRAFLQQSRIERGNLIQPKRVGRRDGEPMDERRAVAFRNRGLLETQRRVASVALRQLRKQMRDWLDQHSVPTDARTLQERVKRVAGQAIVGSDLQKVRFR